MAKELVGWSFTNEYHHDVYPDIDPKRPELSAKGKVVVINGGTRGIGLAIAQAFARAGAKDVVITGRKQETLDAAKSQIEKLDGVQSRVHTFVEDVVDTKAVERTYTTVGEKLGPVDVAVSNAGVTNNILIKDLDPEEFWRVVSVNTKGPFNIIMAFMKVAAKNAVLISINSGIGHMLPIWGPWASYAASKAASARVHEFLQYENPELRVFNLQPGIIHTEMAKDAGTIDGDFPDSKWFSFLPAPFVILLLFVQMQSNCPRDFVFGWLVVRRIS